MNKAKSILHKIKIEASNYGDLKDVAIFVSDDLFKEISRTKDKQGMLYVTKLKNGKFMRGMKHLITVIKAKATLI